ncbi:MAG: hypothetical protein II304_06600 [Bacteroidales bacterium]|nr:hypothetical protein [Bacteroidales bacterium]
MTKAMFQCPKCKKTINKKFNVGELPKPPKCECGEEMNRVFGKVQIGDVVSDEMIDLGQKMLYS